VWLAARSSRPEVGVNNQAAVGKLVEREHRCGRDRRG
jgi:hypothetical protein